MTNAKKIAKLRGSLPRSTRDLVERLRVLELDVSNTPGNSHLRVTNADGRLLGVIASTASCSRTLMNTVSDLRRNGVDVRKMEVR
ncbi:MAG: hypothetical protein WC054_00050 [Candidatus Nanopelagicales bacterium]